MISRIIKGMIIGILGASLIISGATYVASLNAPNKPNAHRVNRLY